MPKYRLTLGSGEKTVTGKSVKEEQDKSLSEMDLRALHVFEQSGRVLKISDSAKKQATEAIKSQRDGELIAITAICEAYAKKKGVKLADMILAADVQSRVSHHDGGSIFDIDTDDLKVLREGFEEVTEDQRVSLLHYYDLLKQLNSPAEVPAEKSAKPADAKK